MSSNQTRTGYRSNAGFSLVELMVSLLISLIVLAAVSSVMVTSKKANTAETAQARMQENARIALQIMARDIRQAGYFGCATGGSNNFSNDLNGGNSSNPITDMSLGLEAANGSNGATSGDPSLVPLSNKLPPPPTGGSLVKDSDIIVARYADGAGSLAVQTPYMNQNSSDLHVAAGNTLTQNEILLVSDCNGGDLFQISNATPSSGSIVHNSGVGVPGNASKDLSRTYGPGAKIMKFVSNTYYVAKDSSGQPSLYRIDAGDYEIYANGKPQCGPGVAAPCYHTDELVQGVETIRILYGIDSNKDGSVDCYIKAGASCNNVDLSKTSGWSKVYSVRIGLLARTLANNTIRGDKSSASGNSKQLDSNKYNILDDPAKTYIVDASTLSTADRRYQRHVFRTTVMVRNHPGS